MGKPDSDGALTGRSLRCTLRNHGRGIEYSMPKENL